MTAPCDRKGCAEAGTVRESLHTGALPVWLVLCTLHADELRAQDVCAECGTRATRSGRCQAHQPPPTQLPATAAPALPDAICADEVEAVRLQVARGQWSQGSISRITCLTTAQVREALARLRDDGAVVKRGDRWEPAPVARAVLVAPPTSPATSPAPVIEEPHPTLTSTPDPDMPARPDAASFYALSLHEQADALHALITRRPGITAADAADALGCTPQKVGHLYGRLLAEGRAHRPPGATQREMVPGRVPGIGALDAVKPSAPVPQAKPVPVPPLKTAESAESAAVVSTARADALAERLAAVEAEAAQIRDAAADLERQLAEAAEERDAARAERDAARREAADLQTRALTAETEVRRLEARLEAEARGGATASRLHLQARAALARVAGALGVELVEGAGDDGAAEVAGAAEALASRAARPAPTVPGWVKSDDESWDLVELRPVVVASIDRTGAGRWEWSVGDAEYGEAGSLERAQRRAEQALADAAAEEFEAPRLVAK